MSEQARILAEQFQMAKENAAINAPFELERKQTLDEGFARIRAELNTNLEKQCAELNREPLVGGILLHVSSGAKSQVSRSDTGTVLTLKFDESSHRATFKCETPARYRYVVEVREALYRGVCFYADGDGSSLGVDPAQCAPLIVRQALAALLGVAS